MKKTNKKGFTIVELVIVIAVIAILAGVLIPTFGGIVETANKNKALQEVKNAYTATLADDISEDGTDVVYGMDESIIVEHSNGTKIEIKVGGEAVVYEGDDAAAYELVDDADGGKRIAVKTAE